MIKHIIFDMGNVLMSFSPEYILSHVTHDLETIETLKQIIFYSGLWGTLDNGDMTFDEACTIALQQSPQPYHSIIKELFNTWFHYKIEDKNMTALVKTLKDKGYSIYLCSNAASLFYTYMDKYDVFQYFDGLLLSSDIKISKPDEAIYEYLFKHFNINPEASLFIDDSLPNIQSASKTGMRTYHYTGNIDLFKTYLINTSLL